MKILWVVGCTGVGKGSLLTEFDALLPEYRVATVRIGSILTERHPIAYFQGHIAPDHTQEEAMKIALDGIGTAFVEGKKLCVVDGLPRKPWQVGEILRRWPNDAKFTHLYCNEGVRLRRLELRDESDPDKWAHTIKRIETDEVEVYRVLSEIAEQSIGVCTSDFELKDYTAEVAKFLENRLEFE